MAQTTAQTTAQMAQDLYRQELESRAMDIWQTHAVSYREKLPRYHALLAKKKELGIKPLYAISAQILAQFPNVKILKIADEDELTEYLSGLDLKDLRYQVNFAEYAIESDGIYRLVCNRVVAFSYEVKAHGRADNRKSGVSVSPVRYNAGMMSTGCYHRLSDESTHV